MSIEKYAALHRLHTTIGQLNYALAVFGDHLAKRESYKTVDGMDAIHFYLVQKHGWLPRDAKSMSADDLRFALSEELADWTLPPNARPEAR